MKDLEKRIARLENLRIKQKETVKEFTKKFTEEEDEPVCDDDAAEEVLANHGGAKNTQVTLMRHQLIFDSISLHTFLLSLLMRPELVVLQPPS